MKTSMLVTAVGLGLALAAPAHALLISGSISFTDGFDELGLPTSPSSSVVSALSSFDVSNVVNVYAPGSSTGDFAGTSSATAFDFLPPGLPTTKYTTDSGFTFMLSSFNLASLSPLTCVDELCGDSISFDLEGLVTGGPGFDPTEFAGTWTAQGSCIGTNDECSSAISASWSSSVVATGDPAATVPVPAPLALLGAGLLGMSLVRRRR